MIGKAAHTPFEASTTCVLSDRRPTMRHSSTTTSMAYKMHNSAAKLVNRSLFKSARGFHS